MTSTFGKGSKLQWLGYAAQSQMAAIDDEGHILVPYSPDASKIEPRLDGENLPFLQPGCPETRSLVQLEPEAVAKTVKKTAPPSLYSPGWIAIFGEEALHLLMDAPPVCTRT